MKFIDTKRKGRYPYPAGEEIENVILDVNVLVNLFKSIKLPSKEHIKIVCRGSSGAMMAALFANGIKDTHNRVTIYYLRKETETAHHRYDYTDIVPGGIIVVIDDFIEMGKTIQLIWEELQKAGIPKINVLMVGRGDRLKEHIKVDYLISESQPKWNTQ